MHSWNKLSPEEKIFDEKRRVNFIKKSLPIKDMEKDIFCRYDQIKDDVIYRSNHFFVKIGFGLIAPGQVMLIPLEHYDSFAELPLDLNPEFEELKDEITQRITSAFSAPFMIEYGNSGSVPHAHIHFIPKRGDGYEITDTIEEMVLANKVPHLLTSREAQQREHLRGSAYLAYEDRERYCVIPAERDASWWKHVDHRQYLIDNYGLKAIHSWENLNEVERELDEQKRALTKKLLRF